jgi:hypothetical protein
MRKFNPITKLLIRGNTRMFSRRFLLLSCLGAATAFTPSLNNFRPIPGNSVCHQGTFGGAETMVPRPFRHASSTRNYVLINYVASQGMRGAATDYHV